MKGDNKVRLLPSNRYDVDDDGYDIADNVGNIKSSFRYSNALYNFMKACYQRNG